MWGFLCVFSKSIFKFDDILVKISTRYIFNGKIDITGQIKDDNLKNFKNEDDVELTILNNFMK